MDLPALAFDRRNQSFDERVRASLEKPQPFLEEAAPRARETVNAAPYPRGRNTIRLVRELLSEERLPHDAIGFFARPLEEPLPRGNVLELLPLRPALRLQHVKPVAHAGRQRQRREAEERERIAERVETLVAEDRHSRPAPAEALRESETLKPAEIDAIGAAEEVIELLGAHGAEIEGAREPSGPLGRFEDLDLVSLVEEVERGGEPHDPRAGDQNLQMAFNAKTQWVRKGARKSSLRRSFTVSLCAPAFFATLR